MVIRRADRLPEGGYQLVCDGVSELVREREAIFLTTLEPDIEVLDPAETRLVPDPSPGFADSRLYLESQLRQAVANDERIHVAQGAAMDPVPYRFEPARQALRQPRQRILIADAVELGKGAVQVRGDESGVEASRPLPHHAGEGAVLQSCRPHRERRSAHPP